jgi:hypothetical protein
MPVQAKKIDSVEILDLDELGYGPEGNHTRETWRAECLKNFLAGKDQFLVWQQSWQALAEKNNRQARFDGVATFEDGSTEDFKIGFGFHDSHALDFAGQVFESDINAKGFECLQPVLFVSATFSGAVWFDNAIFSDKAWFGNTSFAGNTRFGSVTFSDVAWFQGATFSGSAWFGNAIFSGAAVFGDATFSDVAGFGNATFSDVAGFQGAIFSGNAGFDRATFSINAGFQGVTFSGVAGFQGANFSGNAGFDRATFLSNAGFGSAAFSGDAVFIKTKFNSASYFVDATFERRAEFENAHFENVGHFEGACFNALASEVPAFRGCKIDSTRLEFSDDLNFTQHDFTENAIKNISALKRLADEHGQTDQALNFNAMELRAKRKSAWQALMPLSHKDAKYLKNQLSWQVWVRITNFFRDRFWFCVFTWMYEKISDFGRSFTKPLFWLLITMMISLIFSIFLAYFHSPLANQNAQQSIYQSLSSEVENDSYIGLSGYRAATEYSLYRSSNFLDFTDVDKNTASINMRLFGSEIEPWWARLFGFFKGIFTAILLFLIALGLRNKYRVS